MESLILLVLPISITPLSWGGGGGGEGEIVAFAVSVVGGCFCLCLNSTFTDAVKNFIQVLYVDQLQNLHLKCLEVQCTG